MGVAGIGSGSGVGVGGGGRVILDRSARWLDELSPHDNVSEARPYVSRKTVEMRSMTWKRSMDIATEAVEAHAESRKIKLNLS